MSVAAPVIERVTRVTPLGVRFLDAPTASAVSDGLVVTHPVAGSDAPRRALVNPSGVFVMHGFPGLRASEQGEGDAAFWAAPPVRRSYRIDVRDTLGRFHDFWFRADLPARGLFTDLCASPPASPPAGSLGVPLFSTSGRLPPPATAAVRAELRDLATGGPASRARLEVRFGGRRRGVGVADARGRVLVLFPYPELPASAALSPLSGVAPFRSQTWELELDVFYPAASPASTALAEPPDLCDLVDQLPATLLTPSSPARVARAELRYGREVELGILYVSTASSPP